MPSGASTGSSRPQALNLYSATKQQAGKVRSNKNPREDTEQPVVLRNDCITIVHDEDTVLSSW